MMEQISMLGMVGDRGSVQVLTGVDDDDLSAVLIHGGNDEHNRMRMAATAQTAKSMDEIARQMRRYYQGGDGFYIGEKQIAAWYGKDGIRIAVGRSAKKSPRLVDWTEAAQKLVQMFVMGTYTTQSEIDRAEWNERKELAVMIALIVGDLTEEAVKEGILSEVGSGHRLLFDERNKRVAKKLADPEIVRKVIEDLKEVRDRGCELLRYRGYDISQMIEDTERLTKERKRLSSVLPQLRSVHRFITEDEIDDAIADKIVIRAGGYDVVQDFYDEHKSGQKRAELFRDVCGTGGWAPGVSGNVNSSLDTRGGGIRISKSGCEGVNLRWEAVADRVVGILEEHKND